MDKFALKSETTDQIAENMRNIHNNNQNIQEMSRK